MTLFHVYEILFELRGNVITSLSDYAKSKSNLELVIPDNIDAYDITGIDSHDSKIVII